MSVRRRSMRSMLPSFMDLRESCVTCGSSIAPESASGRCSTCASLHGDERPLITEATLVESSTEVRHNATLGTIGPYRLLEVLGEGGMGVVYLAEQEAPIRRRVALKMIKRGMDTEQIIARFEAERQALALMSHPGIARVFDAGASEDGRPYFVMEHVAGLPITMHCDRSCLSV